MLFYNFDGLDNFIKNDLIHGLTQELNSIENIIKLYNNKKMGLSSFITSMVEYSDLIEKNKIDDFYKSISLLKKSLEEIDVIEHLAFHLQTDINSTISLYDKSIEHNENEIKAYLVEYNKQRDELFRKILEFENTYTNVLNSSIELFFQKVNKKSEKQKNTLLNIKNNARVNIETENYDYNILTISEKDQVAYLPFYYSEIQSIYEKSNGQYQTMQEVVNSLYVVSLDRFKNSTISRFRESFNLMRKKEHSSIGKALDLGLELMFKYELNPIIIAACRNLDELDIYLDCLEEDQLYDFKCFEIKFEVMPKISKSRKTDFPRI